MDALSALDPDRFTGIRIGVATIKSLCYALDTPIVGISTLEAIAYNLRSTNGVICPLLDARRSEIYGTAFHGGTEWQRLSEDLCLPVDAFLDRLGEATAQRNVPTTFNFVGEGLLTYGNAVRERLGERAHFADPIFNVPRGATVCTLGAQRLQDGNNDSYWTLVPNYVRVGPLLSLFNLPCGETTRVLSIKCVP